MDSEIEGTLSKFVSNIKLCAAAGMLEGRDVARRDFERWACRRDVDPIKFHKAKCKSCACVRAIPSTNTGCAGSQLAAALRRMICSCWLTKKFNMTQQCALPAQKDNHILGCIKCMTSMTRGSAPLLCFGETSCG